MQWRETAAFLIGRGAASTHREVIDRLGSVGMDELRATVGVPESVLAPGRLDGSRHV
jgi:hypothetical protein